MGVVSLKKGESISIAKAAQDAGSTNPTKFTAGAGWDAEQGKKLDLDLVAVYLKDSNTAIDDENNNGSNADEALTFFGNAEDAKEKGYTGVPVPGALHKGDNRTGEGEGDDEQIEFTGADIPASVKEVAIIVAIYEGADNLANVKNAFARVFNSDDNKELAKVELTNDFADAKGVEIARLIRVGDTADFDLKATGVALKGDSFQAILESYGVTGLTA